MDYYYIWLGNGEWVAQDFALPSVNAYPIPLYFSTQAQTQNYQMCQIYLTVNGIKDDTIPATKTLIINKTGDFFEYARLITSNSIAFRTVTEQVRGQGEVYIGLNQFVQILKDSSFSETLNMEAEVLQYPNAQKVVGEILERKSLFSSSTSSINSIENIPTTVLSGVNCLIYKISVIESASSLMSSRSEVFLLEYEGGNQGSIEINIREETSENSIQTYTFNKGIMTSVFPYDASAALQVVLQPQVTYYLKSDVKEVLLPQALSIQTDIEISSNLIFPTTNSSDSITITANTSIPTPIFSFLSSRLNRVTDEREFSNFDSLRTVTFEYQPIANYEESLRARKCIIVKKQKNADEKYDYWFYTAVISNYQITRRNAEAPHSSPALDCRIIGSPQYTDINSLEFMDFRLVFQSQSANTIDNDDSIGTTSVTIRTIGYIKDLIDYIALDNGRLVVNSSLRSDILAYLYIGYNPYLDGSFSQPKNVFEVHTIRGDGTINLDSIGNAPTSWAMQPGAVISQVKYHP